MKEKIEKALDEIRPFLQSDGGNIELISFTDKEVKVRLLGNCISSVSYTHLTLPTKRIV